MGRSPEVRLASDSAALPMLGHQTGIMAGGAAIEPNTLLSNVLALAKVGKACSAAPMR